MKRYWFAGLCAVSLLMLPSLAGAQGGVQDGIKVGKIYVTGENPGIRLLDKDGGNTLTQVSYWRIIWSPAGPGHILYLTTGDGKSPSDLRVALYDNMKLYDFLTQNIMMTIQHDAFTNRPFTTMQATFTDPGQGTFTDSGEMKDRTVSAKSPKYKVQLVWRDFIEPFQIDTPANSGGANPFGVASLFIPAKSADVIINGKKAPGNVYLVKRGPAQNSTAFLAFSESWLK